MDVAELEFRLGFGVEDVDGFSRFDGVERELETCEEEEAIACKFKGGDGMVRGIRTRQR